MLIRYQQVPMRTKLVIVERLAWPQLLIDNADGDWPQHEAQIARFLASHR
jgi:hypothetical protein